MSRGPPKKVVMARGLQDGPVTGQRGQGPPGKGSCRCKGLSGKQVGWQELRETVKPSRNPERKMQDEVGVGVGQARAGATYQEPGEVSAGFAAEGRSGSGGSQLAQVLWVGAPAGHLPCTALPLPGRPWVPGRVEAVWPGLPGAQVVSWAPWLSFPPLLALCSVPRAALGPHP